MGPIVLQIGIKISLYCSCDAPTCHRSKPELAVFPPGKFTQMSLETMEPCFARCGVSSLVASNSLGWISSIYFFLINNWVCSICDRNDPAIFSLKNPIKCLLLPSNEEFDVVNCLHKSNLRGKGARRLPDTGRVARSNHLRRFFRRFLGCRVTRACQKVDSMLWKTVCCSETGPFKSLRANHHAEKSANSIMPRSPQDGLPHWAAGLLEGIEWSSDCPSYAEFLRKPDNKASKFTQWKVHMDSRVAIIWKSAFRGSMAWSDGHHYSFDPTSDRFLLVIHCCRPTLNCWQTFPRFLPHPNFPVSPIHGEISHVNLTLLQNITWNS